MRGHLAYQCTLLGALAAAIMLPLCGFSCRSPSSVTASLPTIAPTAMRIDVPPGLYGKSDEEAILGRRTARIRSGPLSPGISSP